MYLPFGFIAPPRSLYLALLNLCLLLLLGARLLVCGLEDVEGAHECLVDAHHGPGVVEFAAVVGRREDGHQLPFREELVPVFYNLCVVRLGEASTRDI